MNNLSSKSSELVIFGKLVRTATLKNELYEEIYQPQNFVRELQRSGTRADLFSFLQLDFNSPLRFDYHLEYDPVSILRLTTYEDWLRHIAGSARNKIRKASKAGIDVRPVQFDENLVKGIMTIYNESPIRQGKKFWHYGKGFEAVWMENSTFSDQSEFIGAFYKDEFIGFIKIVHGRNFSSLLQIISKIAYRDKAPTDALLAKAVALCVERNVTNLHYGSWSRRGLGEFKSQRRFERVDLSRYIVPLTFKGRLALQARLHRRFRDFLPGGFIDVCTYARAKWYSYRYPLDLARR